MNPRALTVGVPSEPAAPTRDVLAAERGFVRILGGYTVGLAGGTLLVNERIPVPRFNVVQTVAVARGRQTQFFEAALDHYYQRALRPQFRVEEPVPPHVDETLRGLGFRPAERPELWLWAGAGRPPPERPGRVRRVAPEELETLVGLWAGPRESIELRRQIEVGMTHPNPGEQLVPFVLESPEGTLASAALAYRRGGCLDLEAVTTLPERRGRGAATGLVLGILAEPIAEGVPHVALRSAEPRLEAHLAPAGFRAAARSAIYALAPDAQLVVRAAPSAGPLWRPPRGAPA